MIDHPKRAVNGYADIPNQAEDESSTISSVSVICSRIAVICSSEWLCAHPRDTSTFMMIEPYGRPDDSSTTSRPHDLFAHAASSYAGQFAC